MEPQHCEDNSNFGLTNSRCMDLQYNQQVENVGVRLDENAVGGPGGIGAAADSAVCMGAKFEEHLDGGGDDEEWKYIKENLQSEKQQTQPELIKGFGNGDSGAHENDELFDQFDGNHVFGNGGAVAVATNGSENGANVEVDVEAATHDSEFSTSNTSTSHTPGDEKDVTADVVQVEMKIESVPQHPVVEDFDEEEPSSLATNGTSSLSENQPQQIIRQDDHSTDCENKERPNELDIEMHSQLNPEAKEFVPSFGSNPASPVISPPGGLTFETEKTEPEPTSNDVARHLLGYPNQTDDLIAHSPLKERCADMDGIQLPAEIDFDIGADNRPHELKEEILLDSAADAGGDDNYDQNRQSPGSFVDHGPETSVDLENEFNGESQQINDVMKQSIYVESNVTENPIEDLLNTVQPLPMSFNDESELMQQLATEKEMLQVDEKEHISHSPSTEEMQMNLRNDFYTAEHSTAPNHEFGFESEQNMMGNPCQGEQQPAFLQFQDQTLLMDVSNPFNNSNVTAMADTEASFEMVQNLPANSQNAQTNDEQDNFIGHTEPSPSPHALKLNIDFEHDLTKQNNEAPTSPSPLSTEEKHLVEDTKESPKPAADINVSDLAQNMKDLQLSHHDDGNSTQMEPICDIANAINENANLISVQEPPMQFEVNKQKEPLHDFDLLQTEQILLQPQHEAEKQELETEHFDDEKPHAEIIEPAAEAETKISIAEPPTFKDDETNAIVSAAAAAVAATTAAVATASDAVGTKKSDAATAKKSTTSALTSKPKKAAVVESKRPLDAKKTTTSTTATAKTAPAPRPRTAPTAPRAPVTSSSNAVTEKKSTTSLTATSAGNAAARKTFTARPVPKTTTIAPRPATAHAALKTATSSSATAAAKTATQPSAARRATSSASAAALGSRARASGGSSPTKPTTLGVTSAASAKPKQISPRSNITSQARKGGVAGNASAANPSARSPTKAASSSVDLVAKTGAASNRSKGVAVAASTASIATSTTKRFVARPAPKSTAAGAVNTTSTTTTKTTTSRRITSSSGSKNIAAAEKASLASNNSAVSKKSSPKAPALSPRLGTNNKTGNTTNTTKSSPRTKDGSAKKISPLPKTAAAAAAAPAPITKPKTNGTIEELKLNGDVGIENGVHHDFETAEQLIATVNEVVGDADAAVVAAAAAANVAAESQEAASLIDA